MGTAHRVIKNMSQHISLAGCGCYSAVFSSKAGDRVIKVGSTVDDPWLDFFELIIKPNQNNPFVPKVHSVYIDTENNYYVAVMEKLQENTTKTGDLYKEYVTGWITADDISLQLKQANSTLTDTLIQQLLVVLDAIKENTEYFRGSTSVLGGSYDDEGYTASRALDMHAGNFMMRDSLVVITDPWCSGDMSEQEDLSDWVEHINKSK